MKQTQSAFHPHYEKCMCSQGEHCEYCSADVWYQNHRKQIPLVKRLRSPHACVDDRIEAAGEIERLWEKIDRIDKQISEVVAGHVMGSTTWLRNALSELRS